MTLDCGPQRVNNYNKTCKIARTGTNMITNVPPRVDRGVGQTQ